MATITKSLSKKVDKVNGKSEVLFRFVGGRGLVYRAKSGLFIEPAKWSDKTQKGKQTATDKDLLTFNMRLAELEQAIGTAFVNLDPHNIPAKWIDEAIDRYHHPDHYREAPTTLLAFVEDFVAAADKRQVNGKYITLGTRKHYKSALNHLKGFAEYQGVKDFMFADIDETMYNDLVGYLQDLDESTNRIGGIVKIVKTFIHAAPKELQEQADLSKWRVLTEPANNIYLNEDELQRLEAYDFTTRPAFDRVRDAFLLLAWTGCRYSDLDKVTPDNVKSGMLQIRQQKTGALVTIPLHPCVKRIFDKYDGRMPRPISEQKFNKTIKEACRVVGFDEIEKKTRTKGGKVTTREIAKADMVSSHTGRRSFATNMYKRGVPSLTIMAVTGHAKESSFLKYIKVTKEEHAQRMADMWRNFYN